MKIAFLGDIAFFGKHKYSNTYIQNYLEPLKLALKGYDYVVGNLETPVRTNQVPYGSKSAHICCEPEDLNLLKYLGIDAVGLANNHIYDFGQSSLDQTIKVLTDLNIKWFGCHNKFLDLQKKNISLRFGAYCCYSTNPYGLENGVNELSSVNCIDFFNGCKESNKYPILLGHFGEEHVNIPNTDHIRFFRKLADKYNYTLIGHHPHVCQGIETLGNSLLAYSLGNVLFDDVYTSKSDKPLIKQSKNNKSSMILEIEFDSDGVVNFDIRPVYFGEKIKFSCPSLDKKLHNYSKVLDLSLQDLAEKRKKKLNHYISNRKQKRDFNWYLKRLNYNSLVLIFNAHKNKNKYKKKILKFIE